MEAIEIPGMDVVLYENGGETVVLVFSMNGKTIQNEKILKIGGKYSISGIEISDKSGNRVVSKFTLLPTEFVLRQNYPNPFNPVTTIAFDLPDAGYVSLMIYDLLGRVVINLVNENMRPGSHTFVWDASLYASGVYICRLETDEKVQVQKMLLMK